MTASVMGIAMAACGAPATPVRREPEPIAVAAANPDAGDAPGPGCIILGDGAPVAIVEGRLAAAGGQGFVLRLTRPRCVVGLARAAFVTEVFIASTGADLRPLVDASVRLSGAAIGGTTDVGGPAIVVMATHAERLVRDDRDVP